MGFAAKSSAAVDRREHGRTAVSRPAKLMSGGYVFDAMVKDVSAQGARLMSRGFHGRSLVFIDLDAGMAYEAEVAWRKEAEFGVRFLRSQNLRGLVAANFQPAKQLWAASR